MKDIVVGVFKAITITYQGYDLAFLDKQETYKRYSRKTNQNQNEVSEVNAKPSFFTKVSNNFYSLIWNTFDKLSSPTVCRIITIGSAGLLLINPVSMPFAIAAFSISCSCVIIAVGIEAKRLTKLRIIQNEEKTLIEIQGLNQKTVELVKKIGQLKPEVAKKILENDLLQLKTSNDRNQKKSDIAVLQKSILKGIVGKAPENTASFILTLASFNPVPIAFNIIGTTLNYGQNIKLQHAFEKQMSVLLNEIESLKNSQNLVYENAKGLDMLKVVSQTIEAKNQTLEQLLQHIRKNNDLSTDQYIGFLNKQSNEIEKQNIYRPPSFFNKIQSYFQSFSDVMMKGFSNNSTTKMFTPRINKTDIYQTIHINNFSTQIQEYVQTLTIQQTPNVINEQDKIHAKPSLSQQSYVSLIVNGSNNQKDNTKTTHYRGM